jgi:hypothetical protein
VSSGGLGFNGSVTPSQFSRVILYYRLNLRRQGAEGRAVYGFVSLTLELVMKKN